MKAVRSPFWGMTADSNPWHPCVAMGVRLSLDDGTIEIQRMSDYLLVVERGRLSSVSDVSRYARACEKERDGHDVGAMVVDARVDPTQTNPEAREAFWTWLGKKPFERVALVYDDEMLATELNMLALSRRMAVRAFTSLGEAKSWAIERTTGRPSALPPAPEDELTESESA